MQLSDFLRSEWAEIKKSEVKAYTTLTALFKENYPEIQLAAELEQERDNERSRAVSRLIGSENFSQTHQAIADVRQFVDELSAEQVEALVEAALNNTQIRWILEDEDVRDFFTDLGGRYGRWIDPDLFREIMDLLF